jgi:type 1 glutamine amidotransferase
VGAARVDALLVCGGKYHDFDFARLEILKLLAEHERIRVRVAQDYSDLAAIERADVLVTYTCDVRPDGAQQDALGELVASGRRWFALHGTNSLIDILPDGRIETPRDAPRFVQLLGSQFLAHPPLCDYRVQVTRPDHPLVHGLDSFVVNDELYLAEMHGTNEVLLHTFFGGRAQRGYPQEEWRGDEPRPVLYLHPHGRGAVLYLTLGHCRGRYDMLPLMQEYPRVERCSWESPVYYELLRRGIRWAARLDGADG